MLDGFFGEGSRMCIVADLEKIELGQHTLQFYMTPMVHWPETMMTYELTTGTLFSGDAFGSFGTLDGGVCDDELPHYWNDSEMRRYYSNIVGKYSAMVQKAIARFANVEIRCVAHPLMVPSGEVIQGRC